MSYGEKTYLLDKQTMWFWLPNAPRYLLLDGRLWNRQDSHTDVKRMDLRQPRVG